MSAATTMMMNASVHHCPPSAAVSTTVKVAEERDVDLHEGARGEVAHEARAGAALCRDAPARRAASALTSTIAGEHGEQLPAGAAVVGDRHGDHGGGDGRDARHVEVRLAQRLRELVGGEAREHDREEHEELLDRRGG